MRIQNKIAILALISFTIIVSASTIDKGNKYKNLKVLPRDIGERQLDSIMNSYNKALNVSCDFCHVKSSTKMGTTPQTDTIDFSLDNPMKEEGRRMIRMMIQINKTHFYFDSTVRPEYLNVVSCNTCHRGNPFPINE